MRGRMAGVAGAGVLVLLATGCGSSHSGDDDKGSGKGSAAAPKPLPLEHTSHQVSWTEDDVAVHMKLGLKRLARGSEADLAQAQLDDDVKGMVPYYLTFSYTNTGTSTLRSPDPESNFSVTAPDGVPAKRISLFNTDPAATEAASGVPRACAKSGPGAMAPGRTAEKCEIFMLPKGQRPAAVAYAKEASGTLLWKAGDGKGGGASGDPLPADKAAGSAWEDSHGRDVTMSVVPKSVRAGSLADLSQYKLDADDKKRVPFYVTLEYRNTGKHELLPLMQDGVSVRSAGGELVEPLTLVDFSGKEFDKCRGSVPNTRLKPKSTITLCSIHMLPKGDRPAAVTFRGDGSDPLTWQATVD